MFTLTLLDQLMKETRTSTGDVGLLPRIREMGAFKSLKESKRNAMNDDEKSSNSSNSSNKKFQFVCMGNVNAAKTRIVISEKILHMKSGQQQS